MKISLWLNVLLLTSLGYTAPRIPTEVLNNGLVYCTGSGSSFLPQTVMEMTGSKIVTAQIYNRLFRLKENGEIFPELATGYQFSEDGKVLSIFLRTQVRFQHTPWFTPSRDFNADDVVFSLNRMLGREVVSSTANRHSIPAYPDLQSKIYYQQIHRTSSPYFEQIKLNKKIQSIQADGAYTVRIHLFERDYSILSYLTSQYAVMMSREYAEQLAREDNLVDLESFPVGTGPYQMKNYFRNQYVRLLRNDDYWGNVAQIKHIVVNLANNQSGRLLKFLNNECQIVDALELSQLKILEKNKHENYYVKEIYGMNLLYLAFNFYRPAVQDERLRRAIAQAINRQRLVARLYYGNAQIADRIIPKENWVFSQGDQEFLYGYQPETARNILSPQHLTLNLWVVNEENIFNPSPIEAAELIQHDLNKAGVNVTIRYITRPFLNQSLERGEADYDLILTGWVSRSLDPDTFMHPILSCQTQNALTNLSHWCNADFDNNLKRALLSSDHTDRHYFYRQAQDIVLNQLPIIPLANARHLLVVNKRVKGLNLRLFDHLQFSVLSLEKERR